MWGKTRYYYLAFINPICLPLCAVLSLTFLFGFIALLVKLTMDKKRQIIFRFAVFSIYIYSFTILLIATPLSEQTLSK